MFQIPNECQHVFFRFARVFKPAMLRDGASDPAPQPCRGVALRYAEVYQQAMAFKHYKL